MNTMMLDEVKQLRSGDVSSLKSIDCTVAESGPHLHSYYMENARMGWNRGEFWNKVIEVVDILKNSETWPFEPLYAVNGKLMDGHHRANAAILCGWSKPIPIQNHW